MAVSSGVGAQFGIKNETTWGTAVTVDTFLPFTSESMSRTNNYIEGQGLQAGALGQKRDLHVLTTRSIGGGFTCDVTTNKFGKLFNLLHGNTVTPTTPSGGTLTRNQVHNIGGTTPEGKGLTVQVGRPDVSGTTRAFTYSGCKVAQATFSCEQGGVLTSSWDMVGKDEETATGLATATYAYGKPFNFTQGSVEFDDVVLTDCVRSATITVSIPLESNRFCIGNGALIKEPILNGMIDVTAQLEMEFSSLTQHTAFTAATRRKVELNFTDTTAIEGALFPYVYFSIASTVTTESSPVVQGPDVLSQGITLKGLDDGTNPLLKITYQNTDTAI